MNIVSPSPDDETSDSLLFPTITREEPLAVRVASHLQSLIIDNKLKPGGRMPSERYLGEQFGVSRTVIREAVRSLVAKGLLEVQAGSGASIRADPMAAVANSMSLLLSIGISMGQLDLSDVIEIRRLLEAESSSLAADRATSEDTALLEDILQEAERGIDDENQFISSDIAFHALLAKATHNGLLPVILGSISEALVEFRREGSASPGAARSGLAQHWRIIDCVRIADSAGARLAMNEHMDDALSSGALGIQ
ncbi:transcriptional regulator NanR [soil metagenome]